MAFWKKVKEEFKENKEGILGGGAFGFVVAYYLKNQGVQALMSVNEHGLLDVVMGGAAPVTIAAYKFFIAAIVMGALFGYVLDKNSNWI